MYVDYEFYKDTYGGELIKEDKWRGIATRAGVFVDRITRNRLQDWISVRFAVCALAEAMELVRIQKNQALKSAMAENVAAQGGRVKSITSGRESITYADDYTSAAIAKAAGSPEEEERYYYSAAAPYLANIADARGINLLYAGL
mgnify:CR=1 FL=1